MAPSNLLFVAIVAVSIFLLPVHSLRRLKDAEIRPFLILNAFDQAGCDGAVWFAESLRLFNATVGDIYLFHPKNYFPNSSSVKSLVEYEEPKNLISDLRIAKTTKSEEQITKIIFSWDYILRNIKKDSSKEDYVISVSFQSDSIPVATPAFGNVIKLFEMNENTDLFLLGKTKKLNSVSDWHDLLLVSFRLSSNLFQSWFRKFKETYLYYSSNREAYNMLNPRPAILESIAQNTPNLTVGYFFKDVVCSINAPYNNFFLKSKYEDIRSHFKHRSLSRSSDGHHSIKDIIHANHFESSRCGSIYTGDNKDNSHVLQAENTPHTISSIQVFCGSSLARYDPINKDICLVLDLPHHWKKSVNRDMPEHIGELGHGTLTQTMENPFTTMWKGLLRFKLSVDHSHPKPFCWENKTNTQEFLADARVSIDSYNEPWKQPQFRHPEYSMYTSRPSNVTAVFLTGSEGSARKLQQYMYTTISKMAYAKRHGYDFLYSVSNEYVNYFEADLFRAIDAPAMVSDYFRGIMTKPVMMLDAMYQHLSKEWLIWTDDDIYINPGWMYLPLEAYLHEVPDDKIIVMSNYRSGFTNVIAIRNTPRGRQLVMDWIAVTTSGYIQCHGYDQAALAAILALRISRETTFPAKPLNFTCIYTHEDFIGCNDKNDWSCDFKMERALYRAGFKTARIGFHNGKISSFSKGCANAVIPDFHVVTETERRPRLQCGLCTRLSEIDSSGHWDGPLGGGNLPLLRGKINSYFFNHKAEFLFYEGYLADNACKYVPEVVSKCDFSENSAKTSLDDHDKIMSRMMKQGRHLVSLTDGYAYDLDNGKFCKVEDSRLLAHQREKTFMKDYKDFIAAVQNIPEKEFKNRYQRYGGGEGREFEANSKLADGQKFRGRGAHLYERENYCETCRVKSDSPFRYVDKVVDCRTPEEEADEISHNINMD